MGALTCKYNLDQRCDTKLVRLCQGSYRLIQDAFPRPYKFSMGKDGTPDAGQQWLVYYATRVFGAADAALTLIVHNLAREAILLQRQIFEYTVRAEYYAKDPKAATLERDVEPLRRLRLDTKLGFDETSKRYKALKERCDALKVDRPELAAYFDKHQEEPLDLRSMMGPATDKELDKIYAWNYKYLSQKHHGTILDLREAYADISFDSRLDDPNPLLLILTQGIGAFLVLLRDHLGFDIDKQISALTEQLKPFQDRYSTKE